MRRLGEALKKPWMDLPQACQHDSYDIFLPEMGMETVNVSGLKNNPTDALRKSHRDVVMVMNGDRPDASEAERDRDTLEEWLVASS